MIDILVIIRFPVGGIRTYLNYVFNNKYFSEYRLTIIVPDDETGRYFCKNLKVDYDKVIFYSPGNISLFLTVLWQLKNNNYSLVHSHGYTSGVLASIPSYIHKVKHIITAHDVLLDDQFIGVKGKIKKIYVSVCLKISSTIHCVSNDVYLNILEKLLFLNKNKIRVIKNGIDVEKYYKSEKKDLKQSLGLEQEVYLVGFLGRFMSQKGFRYIVDAIEILDKGNQGQKFIILCYGSDGFLKQEQDGINKRCLQHYFIFKEPVSDLSEIIQGFDAVLMPSLWEACGLLAMEALTAGVPLIASNCIGLREVIKETPALVVRPKSAEDIAKALLNLSKNIDRQAFINYKDKARSRYDSDKTSLKLSKLYNEVLSS